jgi:hypothetical protein
LREAFVVPQEEDDVRQLRWIASALMIGSMLLLAPAGCSDAACDEAVEKMQSCLDQLDCNNVDPLQRTQCTSAKSQGQQAINTMDGVPCIDAASNLADQINKCSPSPATFCRCQ